MCTITDKQIKPPKYAYKCVFPKQANSYYTSPFINTPIFENGKILYRGQVRSSNPILSNNRDCITAYIRLKDAIALYNDLINCSDYRWVTLTVIRLKIDPTSKCFVGTGEEVAGEIYDKPSDKVVTIAVNKFIIDKEYKVK